MFQGTLLNNEEETNCVFPSSLSSGKLLLVYLNICTTEQWHLEKENNINIVLFFFFVLNRFIRRWHPVFLSSQCQINPNWKPPSHNPTWTLAVCFICLNCQDNQAFGEDLLHSFRYVSAEGQRHDISHHRLLLFHCKCSIHLVWCQRPQESCTKPPCMLWIWDELTDTWSYRSLGTNSLANRSLQKWRIVSYPGWVWKQL